MWQPSIVQHGRFPPNQRFDWEISSFSSPIILKGKMKRYRYVCRVFLEDCEPSAVSSFTYTFATWLVSNKVSARGLETALGSVLLTSQGHSQGPMTWPPRAGIGGEAEGERAESGRKKTPLNGNPCDKIIGWVSSTN